MPPVNFYRAVQGREPQAIAAAVALTFMGARADDVAAASAWPSMAAFFSQVGYKADRRVEGGDRLLRPGQGADGADAPQAVLARRHDGRACARRGPARGVRRLARSSPKNPWFARAIVNRVWFWLLGRGIVHEPDDIRPDNPPSNPELLAYLERELVGVALRPEARSTG